MAGVNDLLTSWEGAEDGIPDNYAELILSAYDEDFSIPAARIEQLEGELSAAAEAIKTLKAQNYELVMQLPKAGSDDDEGDDDSSSEDSDENITTDDLFGKGDS